jgi:hypothetical protein
MSNLLDLIGKTDLRVGNTLARALRIGNTPIWDRPYAETYRNLITNPSFETAGAAVTVRTNRIPNPSAEVNTASWVASRATLTRDPSKARYGGASFKLTVTDTTAQNYLIHNLTPATDRVPVTGGETVRLLASVWVPTTNTLMSLQVYEYDSGGVLLTPVSGTGGQTATGGQWTQLVGDFTLKATTVTVRCVVLGHQTMGIGTEWWIDGLFLGNPGTTEYFDGATAAAGDFTYAWSGTANASASIQRGESVPGLSAFGCVAIRSTAWAKFGAYSARIIPTVASGSSYVQLTDLGTASEDRGTFLVTRYQPAVLTGSLNANTGNTYWNPVPQVFASKAPNAIGEFTQRVTAAPIATASSIVLWHGGLTGSGDVWIDGVARVKGTYTGPYFDGATTPPNVYTKYEWLGAAHASASRELVS